jgi:DNA-binding beta-propeller fold protein YncE
MKRLFCSLAALTLLLESVGQVRSDFFYWSGWNDGNISRANLDGSGQQSLIGDLTNPNGVALDLTGGKMYFTETGPGIISRANLDGSGEEILITGLFQPTQIALDVPGSQMYWAYGGVGSTGGVQRANLDGSGSTPLVSGLGGALGLALDLAGGKMYVGEGQPGTGTIRRYNLDGSGEEILITVLPRPRAIALDVPGGKMYFTTSGPNLGYPGTVKRANLDGSGQETLVSRDGTGVPGLALDLVGGKLYWTEYEHGNIGRANLDGIGQEYILMPLGGPQNIALDLRSFAVPAPTSVPSATAFDLTITALDPYGNIDTNYQGTVTFSTTDPDTGVVLPADYTFTTGTGGDNGVHTFSGGVTLVTVGDQTLTVTDTISGIAGSATITVGPGR